MRIEEVGPATLINADCREAMRLLDESSIDAVVTDPPYGLGFMGKGWDHGVPGKEFWVDALRVAKPGAHLLAFGGTRTFHRLMAAIEDAGWEIRDTIMWVYGSGFPKSLDVSKAIDKAAGVERGVSGPNPNHRPNSHMVVNSWRESEGRGASPMSSPVLTAPATEAAKQWEGWGTALKPATEYIVCAQKPLDLRGLCAILAHKIGKSICQLRSGAKGAESSSGSSQSEHAGDADSALWNAAPGFNTPDALFAAMGMLRSGSAIPLSLNTGLSWLDTLGALWTAESMFTTEMKSSLTTDLKILNSLPSETIANSITEAVMRQHGIGSSVSLAESIFSVVSSKLSITLTPSALGLATSQGDAPGLLPEWHPICVARKPLVGTVAANVQQHGTGAINIDGCRIEGVKGTPASPRRAEQGPAYSDLGNDPGTGSGWDANVGRWPANLIHDGSDDVLALFPDSNGSGGSLPQVKITGYGDGVVGTGKSEYFGGPRTPHDAGKGSAARFFYCAKTSRKDRNDGTYGLEQCAVGSLNMRSDAHAERTGNRPQARGNHHPTVKPTELMRYLCRLVTPPGGTVLDPFMGSGSTGKAALKEGFNFVGVDNDTEHGYFDIAVARVRNAVE